MQQPTLEWELIESFIKYNRPTLEDVQARHNQGEDIFDGDPCPILVWQNWKELEQSNTYRLRRLQSSAIGGETLIYGKPISFITEGLLEPRVIYLRKSPQARNQDSNIITIGRHISNDIQLDMPEVSKFHAQIITQPGVTPLRYVVDNGSTNGTSYSNSTEHDNSDLLYGDRRELKDLDFIGISDKLKFQYFSEDRFRELLERQN